MRVISIGPYVSEFLDHNILVLFGQSAPDELAEFAVIHDGGTFQGSLVIGDSICVGSECATVLAIGPVANKNLELLGHLVVKFSGETEPEMPGDVCVEKVPIPSIEVGTIITIVGEQP